MGRYLSGRCPNSKCENFAQTWSHPLVGVDDEGGRVLRCECGSHIHIDPAPKVSKKKTTWPYYHGGCGVTFESESHEQKYTKAHGMTKE